ncbi:MAG: alpha/beta hydrolase [Myxococcaceae bacterium]|nr:alpha/beta hydrolase [Myxococcaceae bacterium]
MSPFHSDLWFGRFLPGFSFGPKTVAFIRRNTRRGRLPVVEGVTVEDVDVPADGAAPPVSLRLYRPSTQQPGLRPALYWMHGGGFIIGSPEQDQAALLELVRTLGLTVAAVRYRLAPEHPAPAAVEDAHAGLRWLAGQAERLHVDPTRIALGGVSAGGGLAATLAGVALDRGEVKPAFQLLIYPMLDDRTVTRTDLDARHARVWTAESNAFAWRAYLGHAPGLPTASALAAAARRENLAGLPPAWLGVGTLDLFHDEDVAYAQRLERSGVRSQLHVVPGAFHGFDAVFPWTAVSKAFRHEWTKVLREALFHPSR